MCADEISNLAELLRFGTTEPGGRRNVEETPEPDRWFPFPSEGYDYATHVCNRCPIAESCREFASAMARDRNLGRSEVRAGQDLVSRRAGIRFPAPRRSYPADAARHRASWSRSV